MGHSEKHPGGKAGGNSGLAGAGTGADYTCADRYTKTMVGTRALATAFELGLIDLLQEEERAGTETVVHSLGLDKAGTDILLGALLSSEIIRDEGDGFSLTEGFVLALEYRDLMEVRASFANLCALDLVEHFSSLVGDPPKFLQGARLFRLFDYSHAFVDTPGNREVTRKWMQITTTLTKYEAGALMDSLDLSRYRKILDIGGNSGEFVLRLCKIYPELRATVFDLPVVCEIGREHVAREPEAGRIDFTGGNALTDQLPGGYDLVSFKSVLHDWPEEVARQFLRRATASVSPGGTLLIFERGPMGMKQEEIPYHLVPYLLFERFFRTPDLYTEELERAGFTNIEVKWIDLDMPFFMVTGSRPE